MYYQSYNYYLDPHTCFRVMSALDRYSSFTGEGKYRTVRFFLIRKNRNQETDGKMIANLMNMNQDGYMHFYYTEDGSVEAQFIDKIPREYVEMYYRVVAVHDEGDGFLNSYWAYIVDSDGKIKEMKDI